MFKHSYNLALAGGDLTVFFTFALLGRADHEASLAVQDLLRTMAPFAVAWFGLSPWFGAFRSPMISNPKQAWWRVLSIWLLCGVAAILLRSWWYDRPIIPAFVGVALSFQGLLLVAWRTAFAAWQSRRTL